MKHGFGSLGYLVLRVGGTLSRRYWVQGVGCITPRYSAEIPLHFDLDSACFATVLGALVEMPGAPNRGQWQNLLAVNKLSNTKRHFSCKAQ